MSNGLFVQRDEPDIEFVGYPVRMPGWILEVRLKRGIFDALGYLAKSYPVHFYKLNNVSPRTVYCLVCTAQLIRLLLI